MTDVRQQEHLLTLTTRGTKSVVAQVINLLTQEGGIDIQTISVREPSLDEVFLRLTGAQLRD